MTDELEKAAQYRKKAKELRAIEPFQKETRESLVRVAEIYEHMAGTMEKLASPASAWAAAAKLRPSANPSVRAEGNPQKSPTTLGDVLYARSKAPAPEQDWTTLVR